MRVAAVDLGTNTTRLLVADVDGGRLDEVHRETRITRLGEGVDARRRLLPVPIARVRNVLADYRRTLESLGAERTLARRDERRARRGERRGLPRRDRVELRLRHAARSPATRRRELTRRGVGALAPGTLVVDIGGGSTELIVDDFHASLEVGSVRHTERFLHGDPPSPRELDDCAAAVRALLRQRVAAGARAAIGVAGTVTTLAALDLGLERATTATACTATALTRAAARAQLDRLAALDRSPSGARCPRSSPSARP